MYFCGWIGTGISTLFPLYAHSVYFHMKQSHVEGQGDDFMKWDHVYPQESGDHFAL
jgi:hypothetical protein